ncbi:hypothetical protein IQ37_04145 [Chryseobacterium piperi]|uniref:Uncharacterized protein n=1 Tax=Chryseobacterium piperi TaxID=558152 RepID=A0A086BL04_9FLAO|nr:hypothetical protein [Chryseobacterium piperi]ASW74575.1 hypothetical protein CJF12_09965 [Chryseobacterium piperi]KFF29618.1 hypothetical protein IQ37_04145 [Chryseobacterium piperi]
MKILSLFFCLILFYSFLPHTYKGHVFGDKNKYLHGYFIDSAQHKVEGLISFNESDCENFLFKKELGEKPVSINVAKCSSFKMGDNRFQTIENINFVVFMRKRVINRAFAKILDTGNVKLYKVTLALSSRDKVHKISSSVADLSGSEGSSLSGYLKKVRTFYFVKRDKEKMYVRLESKKSKFINQLKTYLADSPVVLAALKSNKDFTYNNIEEIIHIYNNTSR